MRSKLMAYGFALLLGAAISVSSVAQQESAAEKAREHSADVTAQQYGQHEPHMAAALQHLRQAEEEMERATPNKGGHLEEAKKLTQQAEAQLNQGIQYYDQHVSPLNKPKK